MSDVRRDDVEGVVTVTFTHDEKMNAVTPGMFEVLAEALRDLGDRDDLRVLVITGEGRYFTSGLDFASLRTNVGEGTDGAIRGSNIRRQYRAEANHDLFDEIEEVEKPVILAAQAHCFGVGVEMGVSCDFRFASETTTFRLPEVQNIAVLPGSGGISRLTRLVGPHWARWLAMAGEPVDAQQAVAIGLVHAVYPEAEFAERVQEFARRLAGMPREAMGLAKVAIDAAESIDRRTRASSTAWPRRCCSSPTSTATRSTPSASAARSRVEPRPHATCVNKRRIDPAADAGSLVTPPLLGHFVTRRGRDGRRTRAVPGTARRTSRVTGASRSVHGSTTPNVSPRCSLIMACAPVTSSRSCCPPRSTTRPPMQRWRGSAPSPRA